MTKDKYIAKLRSLCKGKLTDSETHEIINDYQEYFESGLNEGKTEQELITEFGTPETVLSELMQEKKPQAESNLHYNLKLLLRFCCLLFFFIILYLCFTKFDFRNSSIIDMALVLVLPTLLTLSGVNKLIKIPNKNYKHNRVINLVIAAVFLAIITAIIIFLVLLAVNVVRYSTLENYPISQVILYLHFLIYTFYISMPISAILILSLMNIYKFATGLLFYTSSVFITYLDIKAVLRGVDSNFYSFYPKLIRCFYPFALGIILSIIAILGITFLHSIHKQKV